MPDCPRCHQPVDAQAIACPHCRISLKAFGHPGIPLYRTAGAESLCDTCTYHEDDTCTFPQRPNAKECTLYHNRLQPVAPKVHRPSGSSALGLWMRRNSGLLGVIGLLGISLAIALSRR